VVYLSRPLDEHGGLELSTVGFLIVSHALLEVNVRPFPPASEDFAHLGASHGVHCIASHSVLSELKFDHVSPGSEGSHHYSSMHSLVEEFCHEFLLVSLLSLQRLDFLSLDVDAVIGFVDLVLRTGGVLV